jgi:hypothetical protein
VYHTLLHLGRSGFTHTSLEKIASDKHSSLFCATVSDEGEMFNKIETLKQSQWTNFLLFPIIFRAVVWIFFITYKHASLLWVSFGRDSVVWHLQTSSAGPL